MTDVSAENDQPQPSAPRPGTVHPHLARERALKVLFAADVRGVDPRVLLDTIETQRGALELLDELEPDDDQVAGDEELQLELTRRRRLPLDGYTRDLVAGVASRRRAIDELLGEVADRWSVRRMPAVDRNLLRLAVYELVEQDTPHAVVIDEAVLLAGGFAGEKARGFVNGVLEAIRKRVVAGDVTLAEEVVPAEPVADATETTATTVDAAEGEADGPSDQAAAVADDVEVDEAAQEAYDLALDLLGDDDVSLDELDLDDRDLADDDEDTRFVSDELPLEDVLADDSDDEELATAALRDEDDALW